MEQGRRETDAHVDEKIVRLWRLLSSGSPDTQPTTGTHSGSPAYSAGGDQQLVKGANPLPTTAAHTHKIGSSGAGDLLPAGVGDRARGTGTAGQLCSHHHHPQSQQHGHSGNLQDSRGPCAVHDPQQRHHAGKHSPDYWCSSSGGGGSGHPAALAATKYPPLSSSAPTTRMVPDGGLTPHHHQHHQHHQAVSSTLNSATHYLAHNNNNSHAPPQAIVARIPPTPAAATTAAMGYPGCSGDLAHVQQAQAASTAPSRPQLVRAFSVDSSSLPGAFSMPGTGMSDAQAQQAAAAARKGRRSVHELARNFTCPEPKCTRRYGV